MVINTRARVPIPIPPRALARVCVCKCAWITITEPRRLSDGHLETTFRHVLYTVNHTSRDRHTMIKFCDFSTSGETREKLSSFPPADARAAPVSSTYTYSCLAEFPYARHVYLASVSFVLTYIVQQLNLVRAP